VREAAEDAAVRMLRLGPHRDRKLPDVR
jgi:hypothetical protein